MAAGDAGQSLDLAEEMDEDANSKLQPATPPDTPTPAPIPPRLSLDAALAYSESREGSERDLAAHGLAPRRSVSRLGGGLSRHSSASRVTLDDQVGASVSVNVGVRAMVRVRV